MAVQRSWLARRVESALKRGFEQAYETVRVDPGHYLLTVRLAHDLPIESFRSMFSVPMETLDALAQETIQAGMKMAAAEGAGLGLFGLVTLVPDLSILAAITMRTVQKLSLIYGFEFNTDDEVAELWVAAATAAGVDVSRELVEKEILAPLVPRVIRRIAMQAGTEVSEKLAGRIVPVVSSAIGAGLNYVFVRAWGERAMRHFREKHLRMREKMQEPIPPQLPSRAGSHEVHEGPTKVAE
ncbi:MAG TPA: EcsC family protein [Terriglobales bacterium]|nr:EcsC family protein [Terriglobales bacterium]